MTTPSADTPESSAPAKSGPVEPLRQPYPGDPTKEIVLIRATFAPGDSTPPHHHPGLLTGYVLSGEYEFQLEGQPLQRIAPGAHSSNRPAPRMSSPATPVRARRKCSRSSSGRKTRKS